MNYLETSHNINVNNGGAAVRVWAMPCGEPMQDISITLNTNGGILPAGNLTWNVYFGGHFEGADPYATGATHVGGAVQGTAVIAGAAEVADMIFVGRVIIPTNLIQKKFTSAGVPAYTGYGGFPVVLELINNTAARINNMTATFVFRGVTLL